LPRRLAGILGHLLGTGGADFDIWHIGSLFHEKKNSSFSEEKEAKRLLSICFPVNTELLTDKSFLVLFSKKEHASYTSTP
jgi:hypothetical protein